MAQILPEIEYIINTLLGNYTTSTITTDVLSPTWEYTMTPIDSAPAYDDVIDTNFVFNVNSYITIDYINKVGLYPIKSLSFTNSRLEQITIDNLAALPPPAESANIFEYLTDGKSYMDWQLDVTVNGYELVESNTGGDNGGTTTTQQPVSLSKSYGIRIVVDYDEHKNVLLSLLDERSMF